ncbi:DUF3016 domain-containing protein [Ancylobacter sp. VNQ12]|uniref:DUF3016 domain-containing protein n=1 Tax=Ancylobacter sp. VNQ12 TaxID=3400920 RepID=UPI003C04E27E
MPMRILVLAAAALLLPVAAQAATTVRFVAPQNYTDGNLAWSDVDQRLTLEGLERIIARLADKRLPAGDDLSVEVLNLDLAGKIDPLTSRAGTLRVMRGDTWPSMTLRYTLRRQGRVIAKGEETLRAMNYLMDPVAVRSSEPLRFEKAMLDKWFRTRFATAAS